MSKAQTIEERTEALALPYCEDKALEIVDVEYVKEGGEYYLRVYADKEGGFTIQDCEALSRFLSDELDKEDFIEEAYILEVSSPGLMRPLKKEKDLIRYRGSMVELHLFPSKEYPREIEGILESHDDENYVIQFEDKSCMTIPRSAVSLIRLAFVE